MRQITSSVILGMDKLINIEQAAAILGIQVSTLYSWVNKRMIPHIKLSRSLLRFRRADIVDFVSARSVAPMSNGDSARASNEPPSACRSRRKGKIRSPNVATLVQAARAEILGGQ